MARLDARLTRLEAQWQPDAGLAALLAHARRHPSTETEEETDTGKGLAKLLAEARRWQEEHPS